MNYDIALISAVIGRQALGDAIKLGIKPHHLGPEARIYWEGLQEHYERFGEVPSVDYFQSAYPQYSHNESADSIDALAYELKTRYIFSQLESLMSDVVDMNIEDPRKAVKQLAARVNDLAVEASETDRDLIAGSDKTEVLTRIRDLRNAGGLLGYRWPWEFLNENSNGVSDGNFIYIYGREKSRKTFLLCYLATWFESLGLKVLFFTREMTVSEIAWRLYPMRIKLPYADMSTGNLSDTAMTTLVDALDDLAHRKNLIVTEMDGGMAGVRAKVDEVKPDIVIHDYMMAIAEDEMEASNKTREHEALGSVAGALKRMAMKARIPVIACGHANREGVKAKGKSSVEYAGSDKIVRRVDYGFRIITDDENDRTALILNAGRDAKKFLSFTIDSTLCNGFGELIATNTDWVEEAEAEEKPKETKKAEKGKSGPSPLAAATFSGGEKVQFYQK